jgi:peptidoglycan/xylan/chitin deacetylase (PgdA/CDA1 family)
MGFGNVKKILLSAVTTDVGLMALGPFRPRCASVLFLHRFAVPDLGVTGHDPATLRAHLEYLRARRYTLMSVGDLMQHIEQGIPLAENAVVFTVDDGYADFATIAAPIFAEYDCPVTVFLITDFVSGRLWNWFDRVDWALRESGKSALSVEIGGTLTSYRWKSEAERDFVSNAIVERLKRVDDTAKEDLIGALGRLLEVGYPTTPPTRDRAMTWDDVRACARKGITFGPHTVTHPILSRVDDARSQYEIAESWQRVVAETDAGVPVFCYPNGTPADFSAREEGEVQRAGMKAALSTVDASLVSGGAGLTVRNRFAIPRFSYAEGHTSFVQIASGLEAMRGRVG